MLPDNLITSELTNLHEHCSAALTDLDVGKSVSLAQLYNSLQESLEISIETFALWASLLIEAKYFELAGESLNSIRLISKLPDHLNNPGTISLADLQNIANGLRKYIDINEDVEVESEEEIGSVSFVTGNTTEEKPFNVQDIDIGTTTIALINIITRLKNNEIALDTDFQRSQNLWDKSRQSRLIESLIVKFPLPAFYFDVSNEDKWLVIDGLQRLSTIKNFVVDKSLKLTNLEFLNEGGKDITGKTFTELPREYQRRIEEAQITTFQIKGRTPDDVKFNLFKRINTGGLVLSPAEIRHALNQGPISDLLKNLAMSNEFKLATSNSISPSRMEDRDFVARFLAFYLVKYENYGKKDYNSDLDGYINFALKNLKTDIKEQPDLLANITTDFKKAMVTCYSIFGGFAFRKQKSYNPSSKKKPINKAFFEVLSSFLARETEETCNTFINNKDQILSNIEKQMTDQYYYDSFTVGTGEPRRVSERHSTTIRLFRSTLPSLSPSNT